MSIVLQSTGGGSVSIQEPTTASNFTQTLPASNGNVVLDSATQTLTNKTIQGGAITSGTAVASTSGTSIDFTGIPSWVKRITVMFNGVSTSGTSDLLVQIGSGSVTTSGYASGAGNRGGDSSSTAGFILSRALSATDTVSGNELICLIGSNTYTSSHTLKIPSAPFFGGGNSSALSGSLDRVRITTVNGTDTFDAGSINILYE